MRRRDTCAPIEGCELIQMPKWQGPIQQKSALRATDKVSLCDAALAESPSSLSIHWLGGRQKACWLLPCQNNMACTQAMSTRAVKRPAAAAWLRVLCTDATLAASSQG